MKPFDLNKALAGEPVVTRAGIPVTEVYYFKTARINFPVRAVVNGEVVSYTKNGRWGFKNTDNYDLFMAPVKKQEWINIHYHLDKCFPASQYYYVMGQKTFTSKEEAEKHVEETGAPNFVKSVLIREWEE